MKHEEWRSARREQERLADLMAMLPQHADGVLDLGTRDGYVAMRLADRFTHVTALDLQLPVIDDPRIHCVAGNATALEFADGCFDLVFCAEVLEHIPSSQLTRACAEMARVARRHVLIGVPYLQDLRLGRSTCRGCGTVNPPWGHVNSFDEAKLLSLFPGMAVERRSFVGQSEPGTNSVSAWLMDQAGNPYGTYVQDEPCLYCNAMMSAPAKRTIPMRLLTKAALTLQGVLNIGWRPHGNWIHLLLSKSQA